MASELPHALVVGGSGMLRGVSLELARRGHPVSVLARNARRLAMLARESEGRVLAIACDYRESALLGRLLRDAAVQRGPFGLVVAWVHSVAPDAPLLIARNATARGNRCRFLHVLGSAAADPAAPDAGRRFAFGRVPGVTYQEVILGFVREGKRSRWLTNDEICDGVLAGIDGDTQRSIVGTVEPWSARP